MEAILVTEGQPDLDLLVRARRLEVFDVLQGPSDPEVKHWAELSATRPVLGRSESRGRLIVEFGDYECPACRQSHAHVATALTADPSVTVGFRHYPITSIHAMAEGAARAAICAEFQGRFQGMHSLLMETKEWRDNGDWSGLARRAAIPDLPAFEECLGGDEVEGRLQDDR